jgi:hypothetical protein
MFYADIGVSTQFGRVDVTDGHLLFSHAHSFTTEGHRRRPRELQENCVAMCLNRLDEQQ